MKPCRRKDADGVWVSDSISFEAHFIIGSYLHFAALSKLSTAP